MDNKDSIIDNISVKLIDIFDSLINAVIENALSMNLEDLAELYSKKIDKTILDTERKLDCNYVGGQLRIYCIGEDYFGMSISLYFQDKNKQWKKTVSKSEPQSMKYLTVESIERLNREKTVAFEIDAPKKETIKSTKDASEL